MLLAFDTSTPETVLALAEGDGTRLATMSARAHGKNEETLLPLVDAMLAAVGRDRAAIRTVAVGLGPGGFTSLRVGVASAKGMALGLGANLVGVGSLRVIARGALTTCGEVAVFSGAKKGEVHAASYSVSASGSDERMPPMHGAIGALASLAAASTEGTVVVVGDGCRVHRDEIREAFGDRAVFASPMLDAPRPDALLAEAMEALARGELAGLDALEPLYVKPTDAKLPAVKLRTSLSG